MCAQKKKHKHRDRKRRVENYHDMLDAELSDEKVFQGRVIRTIDTGGVDIAPDGREIRADFWRYMRSRSKTRSINARAGQYHMERAVGSLHPSRRCS